jgi:hypothetical protein
LLFGQPDCKVFQVCFRRVKGIRFVQDAADRNDRPAVLRRKEQDREQQPGNPFDHKHAD